MIPLALGAFQFIAGCKICRIVLLAAAAALALWLYIGHAKHKAASEARAAAIAEMQAATQREHERRQAVLEQAQAAAQQTAAKLADRERENATLLARIAQASRVRDAVPCLDRAGVDRLRTIGQDRP